MVGSSSEAQYRCTSKIDVIWLKPIRPRRYNSCPSPRNRKTGAAIPEKSRKSTTGAGARKPDKTEGSSPEPSYNSLSGYNLARLTLFGYESRPHSDHCLTKPSEYTPVFGCSG